jgi:hypothetical protein
MDDLPIEKQKQIRTWASRLRRLVKDAPEGIVALVGNGSIEICAEEELDAAFNRDGDLCRVESLMAVLDTRCFVPYGESM